jgi:hypothetical protein
MKYKPRCVCGQPAAQHAGPIPHACMHAAFAAGSTIGALAVADSANVWRCVSHLVGAFMAWKGCTHANMQVFSDASSLPASAVGVPLL